MPVKSDARLAIAFCRSDAASPLLAMSKYRWAVVWIAVLFAASISLAVWQLCPCAFHDSNNIRQTAVQYAKT